MVDENTMVDGIASLSVVDVPVGLSIVDVIVSISLVDETIHRVARTAIQSVFWRSVLRRGADLFRV